MSFMTIKYVQERKQRNAEGAFQDVQSLWDMKLSQIEGIHP